MLRKVLIFILILLTLSTTNPPVKLDESDHEALQTVTVYIVGHYVSEGLNYHAGIVLPRAALDGALDTLPSYFTNQNYFEFGWGDSGFYQTPEVTISLAAEALFWPTDSVMHVVAFNPDPTSFFRHSRMMSVEVSLLQAKLMATKIAASFTRDENQTLRLIGPGRYDESRFFDANGYYHGLYTCNSWTADVLKAGGLPLYHWFNLTSGSIFLQLANINSLPDVD